MFLKKINQHIEIMSWSRDAEDWSNDAENSALQHRNTIYILKYIT